MATPQRGHRLERLFSRRRSANSAKAAENGGPSGPVFPQPSFIRPTSSRMMAREEVAARTPSPKSQTYKHHRASLPLSIGSSELPNSSGVQEELHERSSSDATTNASNLTDLKVLRHFNQATRFGQSLHHPSRLPSGGLAEITDPVKGYSRADTSPTPVLRLDTPPTSDREDSFSRALEQFKFPKHSQHPSQTHNIPTPGPSPDMSPVLDIELHDQPSGLKSLSTRRVSMDALDPTAEDIPEGPKLSSPRPHKRKGSNRLSVYSPILKEPSFHDFMDLSDDDIAEEHPDNSILPSATDKALPLSLSPPSTASSSLTTSRSRAASLLTLPPPFASRPATAAAFEAARIAARYNFDLVYVVNLWPDWDIQQGPSSTPTLASQAPMTAANMTGRLLAAYGLSTVKSPFRISAAVHTKILQTEGWIEYRNEAAESNEFARGYACAFCRGEYGQRRGSADSCSSTATGTSVNGNIDRGIVFAAYRKPNPDGDGSSVSCSKSELSVIYRDAEALVEMLIDIHMVNRLRYSTRHGLHSDETGPMPVHGPTEITLG
ncbi:hypothetical protein jhhlp_007217 [Lomentospora prolificans]|uniref:Uncharacterized protein n=1 Tax=Lomentospora prolificans TaxID=41688 RepID=A0A2N3N215_9PEZI|nr:hypothetical protein jhhlp_007217 [Lomentospora prolificans]